MARPRNERKRAEAEGRRRLEQEEEEEEEEEEGAAAGNAGEGGPELANGTFVRNINAPPPVNRNIFRRNMGEWVVAIDAFKKEHPEVYEEERRTHVDKEAGYFVRLWRETVTMPEEDEEELDKRLRHPEWIKKRAIAHYNLAMCHDTGYGVGMSQKNPVTAFQHYLAAAELGHVEAMCCAGSCYMYAKGVAADVVKAVDLYVRAAKEGSREGSFDAMYNLGMCFRKGVGRPQDGVAAVKWFKAAAACKHPDGMYALAMSHLHGYGGAKEDAEAAAKLLVEICDRYQHPSAHLSLAKCFVTGLGVEADESMGLKLCLLALGDPEKAKEVVNAWKMQSNTNLAKNPACKMAGGGISKDGLGGEGWEGGGGAGEEAVEEDEDGNMMEEGLEKEIAKGGLEIRRGDIPGRTQPQPPLFCQADGKIPAVSA